MNVPLLGGVNAATNESPGAIIGAVGSIAVWVLAQAGSNALDGAVDKEIMLILRDGAWIGVRNSLATAAAAGALLLLMRMLTGDVQHEQVWEAPTGQASPTDAPPV